MRANGNRRLLFQKPVLETVFFVFPCQQSKTLCGRLGFGYLDSGADTVLNMW